MGAELTIPIGSQLAQILKLRSQNPAPIQYSIRLQIAPF